MSQSASQAWAFYREVARERAVWTLEDAEGYPTPKNSEGTYVLPMWSSRSRAERIIKNVPVYSAFEPALFSWELFRDTVVPDLEEKEMKVGVNWSGQRLVGYDIEPASVVRSVEALIEDLSLKPHSR